jgi:hypothetical protein
MHNSSLNPEEKILELLKLGPVTSENKERLVEFISKEINNLPAGTIARTLESLKLKKLIIYNTSTEY